MYIWDICF